MITKRSLLFTVLATLVLTSLLLTACGGGAAPEEPAAPAEEPMEEPMEEPTEAPAEEPMEDMVFKLGVMGPFSGPSARTGDEFKQSATMALEAVDYKVGPYTIEPVWIDSQSDPAKASQAYEQAVVQDGVQAGVLNWHSSVAVSVMEVTAKHQIPHVFGMGATTLVNETYASDPEYYGYWAFKGWPSQDKITLPYVQSLEAAIASGAWSPEEKTVAIFGEDTDWGRGFGTAIKGQLEDAGWTVVAEEYFAIDQTEFYPLLNKFNDLNPALIAGTSTALPVVSNFIKQVDEVGLNSLVIMDGLGWFGEWYDSIGDASNYVLDQIPGWATDEGKAFAAEFEAQAGFPPSPSAGGLSYDGVNFWLAMANATYEEYGELTSETIYQFIQDKLWTGEWAYTDGIVMSNYSTNPDVVPDPVVGEGYYIFPVLQYFDGEGKVIFPSAWAEQELQPKP